MLGDLFPDPFSFLCLLDRFVLVGILRLCVVGGVKHLRAQLVSVNTVPLRATSSENERESGCSTELPVADPVQTSMFCRTLRTAPAGEIDRLKVGTLGLAALLYSVRTGSRPG